MAMIVGGSFLLEDIIVVKEFTRSCSNFNQVRCRRRRRRRRPSQGDHH